MRRVDFENGGIIPNIVQSAFPMLIAQVLNLLYNIVDRIYIARIPEIGTAALGAVGLCFPVIVIITAFSNLFGSGGAPLFAIARGGHEQERARRILHTSFTMLVYCAVVLMAAGPFVRPAGFGAVWGLARRDAVCLALHDDLSAWHPACHADNRSQPVRQRPGLCDHRHDERCDRRGGKPCSGPDFYLCAGYGCRRGGGSRRCSPRSFRRRSCCSFCVPKRSNRLRLLPPRALAANFACLRDILSLGTAGFIMQLTNSVVTICCNNVLAATGGDLYVSVMTILSSVRQMVETPLSAITDGSSPVISYNYGARRAHKVKKACITMALLAVAYTLAIWLVILLAPRVLIAVFQQR